MKKILIFIIITITSFIPTTVFADTGIEKFYINATVEQNGDLTVEEYFYLNGEFNGMEREILYRNDDLYPFRSELNYYGGSSINNATGIELLEIRALKIDDNFNFENIDGTLFEEANDASIGDFGVYTKDVSSNGETYLIYLPDNKNQAFYIKYTLKNIVVVHNDIAEIYWNAIGNSLRESIGELVITVNFPNNTDTLRVWAHGPLNGVVKNVDNKTLNASATYVYSYQSVDIRAAFDKNVVPYSNKLTNVDALEKIINYEENLANQANYEREQENYLIKESAYDTLEYCKEKLNRTCYNELLEYISMLTDEEDITILESEAKNLHTELVKKEEQTAREDVSYALSNPTYYWYSEALESIDVLENTELKEELLEDLVPVKNIIIENETKKDNGIKLFSIIISIALCILIYHTYKKYDKDYNVDFSHKYLRDFPDNLSPSSVEYLMKKKITEDSISSEIMLLIYEKKIKIEERKEKKDILLIKNAEEINLNNKEKEIMKMIFSNSSSIYLNKLKKQARQSTSFYNKWKQINKLLYNETLGEELYEGDLKSINKTKEKQNNFIIIMILVVLSILPIVGFFSFIALFVVIISQLNNASSKLNVIDKKSNAYKYKKNCTIINILIILLFIFLITYLNITTHFIETSTIFLLVTILIAISFIIYLSFVKKRTEKGSLSYKKWHALKNFLQDFSLIDEKDLPEIILWEKYLAYAVVLGCADKLAKTMKLKMENMDGNYTFDFDPLVFTNMNIVSHAISSSVHSSRSYSNSSSSGGSFSSGSGGGGGFSSGGGSGGGGGGGGRF